MVLTAFLIGSAVISATVTAQDSEPIPEDVESILQSDMSTVTAEQLQTVQEWYSANSDSLPKPAKQRVLDWIVEAENSDIQSSGDSGSSETESRQYNGSEWDTVEIANEAEWANTRVYDVVYDYEEDVARVYVETDSATTITLIDGTPTQSMFPNKTSTTVNGRAIIEVKLWKTSNEHITIIADGRQYYHFGQQTELKYDEPTKYPIVVGVGTGIIVLALIVGLHRFSARYRNEAKNPIEG
ncbi:hypothetical protein [Halobacterium noricense]|uniref:hypothetical protein n=1 Tax=Halobacterium noricense TaxID=223182 RepID=UPI001E31B7B5|nr:hypothetical protein [Halobacterium noricense]UHH25604.1 hypothetical protein LT974_01370 [Halobacterium noricense]